MTKAMSLRKIRSDFLHRMAESTQERYRIGQVPYASFQNVDTRS